jgi:hypothetical protein
MAAELIDNNYDGGHAEHQNRNRWSNADQTSNTKELNVGPVKRNEMLN